MCSKRCIRRSHFTEKTALAAAFAFWTLTASAAILQADPILVNLNASAQELGGQQEDRFTLSFQCNYPEVLITNVIYDMTQANKVLWFDVAGPDSFDFTTLAGSQPTVNGYLSSDNAPVLVIDFDDFHTGQTLIFGIDVDGLDCSTFTSQDFAGTRLVVMFDVSRVDNSIVDPVLILTFEEGNGGGASTGGMVAIPEPTVACSLGAAMALMLRLKRRGGVSRQAKRVRRT